MRIFGREITIKRVGVEKGLSPVPITPMYGIQNLWRPVQEPYPGAWQQSVVIDQPMDLLSFSGVYSPMTLIASDVAKLRVKLTKEVLEEKGDSKGQPTGITEEVHDSPFLRVLKKPNHYQNRIKFIEQWVLSKLIMGNTYVLKQREPVRRLVERLYILDARRVTPMVTEDGGVYYSLSGDPLSGFQNAMIVPASEIIHDMMPALWHPLVGVPPLYAAGLSATMGRKIQNNSAKFFDNMSRPSGMLSSLGTIPNDVAERLKKHWEENFSGENIGKIAVLGDGLKYEAMTIPPEQAQLVEQLEWSTQDIAATLHMPLFKVGGPLPAGATIDSLNQVYYSDCLQSFLECIEICLDEGLELPSGLATEFDLDGLLRMDQAALIKSEADAIGAAMKAPNESRRRLGMKPKEGGDSLMMQQQNYSLEALERRDEQPDLWATTAKPSGSQTPQKEPVQEPTVEDKKKKKEVEEVDDGEAKALIDFVAKGLFEETT